MKLLLFILALSATTGIHAITIIGGQTAPNEWSYDVVFAPDDNYSICQPNTTITLVGLSHVLAASGPITTDLPGTYFDQTNTNWIPEVLAGGLGVRWTHLGPGTGNYDVERRIFGFRVIADPATNGQVSLATSGVALDGTCPTENRDIATLIDGPTGDSSGQFGLSLDLVPGRGGRSLTVIGPASRTYRLQAAAQRTSTNWLDIASLTLTGHFTNIVDTTSSNATTRFYRLASP